MNTTGRSLSGTCGDTGSAVVMTRASLRKIISLGLSQETSDQIDAAAYAVRDAEEWWDP